MSLCVDHAILLLEDIQQRRRMARGVPTGKENIPTTTTSSDDAEITEATPASSSRNSLISGDADDEDEDEYEHDESQESSVEEMEEEEGEESDAQAQLFTDFLYRLKALTDALIETFSHLDDVE